MHKQGVVQRYIPTPLRAASARVPLPLGTSSRFSIEYDSVRNDIPKLAGLLRDVAGIRTETIPFTLERSISMLRALVYISAQSKPETNDTHLQVVNDVIRIMRRLCNIAFVVALVDAGHAGPLMRVIDFDRGNPPTGWRRADDSLDVYRFKYTWIKAIDAITLMRFGFRQWPFTWPNKFDSALLKNADYRTIVRDQIEMSRFSGKLVALLMPRMSTLPALDCVATVRVYDFMCIHRNTHCIHTLHPITFNYNNVRIYLHISSLIDPFSATHGQSVYQCIGLFKRVQ